MITDEILKNLFIQHRKMFTELIWLDSMPLENFDNNLLKKKVIVNKFNKEQDDYTFLDAIFSHNLIRIEVHQPPFSSYKTATDINLIKKLYEDFGPEDNSTSQYINLKEYECDCTLKVELEIAGIGHFEDDVRMNIENIIEKESKFFANQIQEKYSYLSKCNAYAGDCTVIVSNGIPIENHLDEEKTDETRNNSN